MWTLCKITGKGTKIRQGHLSPSWAVFVLFVYFVLECCRAYLGDGSPVPHLRTLLREACWTGPGGTGVSGVCMAAKPRQLWCRAGVLLWEEGRGASGAGAWAARGLSCRHLSGPGCRLLSFMPLASAHTRKASFTPLWGFAFAVRQLPVRILSLKWWRGPK